MPVAAMLAGTVHQLLDLALGEVASLNCQIYDGWRMFLGCRFHADKPYLRATYCLAYALFVHSLNGRRIGKLHRDRDAGRELRGRRGPRGRRPRRPLGGTFQFQTFISECTSANRSLFILTLPLADGWWKCSCSTHNH